MGGLLPATLLLLAAPALTTAEMITTSHLGDSAEFLSYGVTQEKILSCFLTQPSQNLSLGPTFTPFTTHTSISQGSL